MLDFCLFSTLVFVCVFEKGEFLFGIKFIFLLFYASYQLMVSQLFAPLSFCQNLLLVS